MATVDSAIGYCRAVLTSDSDPIEVWLVTNNDPVHKPEAEPADRLQLPLPPQPLEQPPQVASLQSRIQHIICHAILLALSTGWHVDRRRS